MHRHRVMYNNVHSYYHPFSYCHHGINVCSPYDIAESLPIADMNICVPQYCQDYAYQRGISHVDYPYYNCVPRIVSRPVLPPLPPIALTNVQNDFYYLVDDPDNMYDDDHGNTYRLSRSKVQLVDIPPEKYIRTSPKRLVASKHQRNDEPSERIIIPRSTVVRHKSLPAYVRPKPVRLVPLYHSADPQYLASKRRSMAKKLVPLTTVSHSPQKRTIKVRSLSP
ncbi:unnamed protein product [Rotaria sordida]|uniref:Uncharacterized protein n=1 Tax=Rotaria sordida TaxID=392033 RepID=A0A813N682_9BILA|nr:unnamed protein product [Rotaria sordida]CAF0731012.1 unnamed protein product [Rotaria sordida]CAF0732454.1 unnamed protein product [Rotaria sordida]